MPLARLASRAMRTLRPWLNTLSNVGTTQERTCSRCQSLRQRRSSDRAPDRIRARRPPAARLAPFSGRPAAALPPPIALMVANDTWAANIQTAILTAPPSTAIWGAADVAGQWRGQERHCPSELLRLAEASGRDVVARMKAFRDASVGCSLSDPSWCRCVKFTRRNMARLSEAKPRWNLHGIDAAGRDAVDRDTGGRVRTRARRPGDGVLPWRE